MSDPPLPGEKRRVQSFDIRLNTLYESTIDILFSKNKVKATILNYFETKLMYLYFLVILLPN